VLNGPASVLFGIGGIGGSINIVPRRPSRRSEHTVRVAAASYDTYRLAFDSTGPVAGTDRVLYRVDVSRQASNGYIDRGTSESTALSGAIDFVLSPKLKATLINDFAYIEPMNYNGLPLVNGGAQRSLLEQNYGTSDVDVHFYENSSRLELTWTPSPEIAVRNITSLLRGIRLWKQGPTQLQYRPATADVLRTSFGRFDQGQDQWNNQVEFTWKRKLAGHENTFVAGTDGEWLDFTRYVTNWPGVSDIVSLVNPTPGSYPPVAGTITQAQNNVVHRYSLFSEDRVKMFDRWSLVGGVRWDTQNLNRIDLVGVPTGLEKRYNPVNWRSGTVVELTKDMNVYAQYSAATDALSNACCITAAQMAYTASRGTQIEAGIKQSIAGGRAEWTVAGYQIVKNDLLIPDPIAFATLIQVGQQSSTGVEVTGSVDFGHGLRVAANGTVLRPRYDDFFEVVSGARISRSGNKPTNVPWQSGNLLAFWSFKQQWLAQRTVRFVGDRYIDNANTLVMPAYTVVDAGIRRSLSSKVALDFRLTNLTDAFYAYNFSSNGLGGGNWNIGQPRSFEVSLTAGF
jgi:iron complex outermembrane receptor protein